MLKYYVQFCHPALSFCKTSEQEVSSRDEKPKLPDDAYGYRYFDREEIEKDGETLIGPNKNYSKGWIYFGRKLNFKQAVKEFPTGQVKTNMEINKISHVVVTKFGQVIPLDGGDIVIEEKACSPIKK